MNRFTGKAIALCALLLLAVGVSGQYRAGVQGVVTDQSGALVPEASVTVTNVETNISRTATTSNDGVYSVPGLAPGHYTVMVEKMGFAVATLTDVVVDAERMRAVNIQLAVGQTTESVTVSESAAPALETGTATISGTITNQQVTSLPSFGRDPFRLLALSPGTFGTNARAAGGGSYNLPGNAGPGGTSGSSSIFQTENQVQVSANGTRVSSNSFLVDGASVNSLAWGGAAVVTPNSESVSEIKIDTSSYSAEHARAGGAQVMVVSKNGTNKFHGSGLVRWARPDWNAYQRWNGPTSAVQRVNDRFNQFAGSIGGPIIKNKLFFFFSYERLGLKASSTGSGWYETPQFLQAVRDAKPNSIAARFAGYPGEGASYTSISQSATCAVANIPSCANIHNNSGQLIGLDIGSPLKLPLGTRDPSWGVGTPGVGGGLDGIPDIMFVNTSSPRTQTAQQYNGRMDYQVTSKDLIAVSIFATPVDTESFNGPARSANFWNNNRLNHADTLLWNRTIAPTMLNEARLSLSRWSWDEVESNPQEPWGLPTAGIDGMRNAGVQYFGAPGPSVFAQTTYNFRDTASWVRGNHFIKFGTDIYWEQNNSSRAWSARPSYSFRNIWDFANDAPYRETGNFDPRTGVPTAVQKYIRSRIYGFFVQDDWKLRPNLTVNLGVRWEYFEPLSEKYDQISNAILGPGESALTGLRMKLGGNLHHASKNNWAPQVGFAWTPQWIKSSRLVLRGGFGVGFTRTAGSILLDSAGNPPFVSSVTLPEDEVLYSIPDDVHQFDNWPANPATILTIDPTTNLPATGSLVLSTYPQDMATPTTYRYSLEAQYDLGRNWVATVGYQGSRTRFYTRKLDLNWLYPQNRNSALQRVYQYRNDGNAYYDALLTQVKHRFSDSFEADVQYRWSTTIDTGSNDYHIGEYPYSLSFLKGMADFDARHNVKAYGIYNPKLFRNGWMARWLDDWQVSGILNWNTGFPWTPVFTGTSCNVIYQNSGYCTLRPGAYLGGAGSDYANSTFKKTNGNFPGGAYRYFTVPEWSSDGTIPPAPGVARNSFRGPGYLGFDMSLQKSIPLTNLPGTKFLGESARIELRGDFFNLFNNLNVANVNTSIGSNPNSANPLFGQAQSGLAGRVINVQARISF